MIKLTRISYELPEEVQQRLDKIEEGYQMAKSNYERFGGEEPIPPNFKVEDKDIDILHYPLRLKQNVIDGYSENEDGDTEIYTTLGKFLVAETVEELDKLLEK